MNKLPAQKINGLIDGISVLQELAMSSEPASGKIIAETLGLPIVRVNRILKTLAYLGFTYRNTSRKYSVGPGMHVLAAQSMAASGLLNRALPYLKQLSQSGRTVALGVLWKDQVCYLFHNSGDNEFADGFGRMFLFPVVESSIGMALLAELSVESIKLQTGIKTDNELIKILSKIRKQGYASVKYLAHISLAVPIGNPAYAGIAVSGIETASEERHFISLLRRCAADISK